VTIGVLGLQGAYARHRAVLEELGAADRLVRYPEDLRGLDGLIIPGGETTTMSKLLDKSGLRAVLPDFARERPVFGTCAGMVLMAREAGDARVEPLDLLDIAVARNAYGRQVDSFTCPLDISLNGTLADLRGVFIRAPRILRVGSGVEVLAEVDGEPVFVRQGRHMACAFHPELSGTTTIHQYFLDILTDSIRDSSGPAGGR